MSADEVRRTPDYSRIWKLRARESNVIISHVPLLPSPLSLHTVDLISRALGSVSLWLLVQKVYREQKEGREEGRTRGERDGVSAQGIPMELEQLLPVLAQNFPHRVKSHHTQMHCFSLEQSHRWNIQQMMLHTHLVRLDVTSDWSLTSVYVMAKLTTLFVRYFSNSMMGARTIYFFLLFPAKDLQWRQNRATKLNLADTVFNFQMCPQCATVF